jgi:hypothetical protein
MANVVLEIDGTSFNDVVNLISLKRSAHFFDKFAKRDIKGILHRELIGVYVNYTLEICVDDDLNSYNELWEKLIEPAEKHEVVVSSNTHWDNDGRYNCYKFEAYFADIKDEAFKLRDNHNVFRKLTVEFIATKPHNIANAYQR